MKPRITPAFVHKTALGRQISLITKGNMKIVYKSFNLQSSIFNLKSITPSLHHFNYFAKPLIILFSLISFTFPQAIQFSIYVDSEITATVEQDLNFGDFLVAGQGLTEINLGDPNTGIFRITGNEDMEIILTTVVPANLTVSGGGPDVIPLTLDFAYNNKGADNPAQAVTIVGGTARIPMKARISGRPAGPPPTPPHSGYIPADVNVYLYMFGNINVGSVAAGLYEATVSITVTYD